VPRFLAEHVDDEAFKQLMMQARAPRSVDSARPAQR
jgi:hypothetical protein